MIEETDPVLKSLLEALAASPDNVPLLRHVADAYTERGRFAEAESMYRDALAKNSEDDGLRLALARCYAAQEKDSHAELLLDLLVGRDPPVAEAFLLRGQLAMRRGDVEAAAAACKRALQLDPTLQESELAQRLGVTLGQEEVAGGSVDDEGAADVVDGRVRVGHELDDDPVPSELERPKIAFDDVGGMSDVKEEISIKVIQPLAHPELFEAYGKKIGGGMLLYGPPGCGKTYLARATAGEVGASFLSIGIHDVLDMWIGKSERNLHALFEHARNNTPCVLFFDEVDALAGKRADMQSGAARQTINQFLAELDGAERSNDGVLVLAATNAPWYVDPAFRRPGRFDRVLFVPPPDAEARAHILELHLSGKPQGKLDLKKVAKKTDGFSGADLKAVVDQTVEGKLREALKQGAPSPIEQKDLERALKQVKPTTREWFATARNHVLFANTGGLYDDLARYMKIDR